MESCNGDRDELETELWRLRSVEYDLRQQIELNKETAKDRDEALRAWKEENGRAGIAEKRYESERKARKEAERKESEARNKLTKLEIKYNTAVEELKTLGHAEYLEDAYGFVISNKLPVERNRKRR